MLRQENTLSTQNKMNILLEIPRDILLEILSYLSPKDLAALSKNSKLLNKITETPSLWQNLVHNYLTVYTSKIENSEFRRYLINNINFFYSNVIFKEFLVKDTSENIDELDKMTILVFKITRRGFDATLKRTLSDERISKLLTTHLNNPVNKRYELHWIIDAFQSQNPLCLKIILDHLGKLSRSTKLDLFNCITNKKFPHVNLSVEEMKSAVTYLFKKAFLYYTYFENLYYTEKFGMAKIFLEVLFEQVSKNKRLTFSSNIIELLSPRIHISIIKDDDKFRNYIKFIFDNSIQDSKMLIQVFKELLDKKNDKINRDLRIFGVICANKLFDINTQLDTHMKYSYLHLAAMSDNAKVFELLLQQPMANPNVFDHDGRTPLHHAVIRNHIDIVKVLVDDKETKFDLVDLIQGKTALHYSVEKQNEQSVLYLLNQNPTIVDQQDHTKDSALHYALNPDKPNSKILKKLIECGADSNIANQHGITPLHLAAKNASAEIMGLLLEKNPDATIVDNDKCNALHYAVRYNNSCEMLTLLVEYDITLINCQNNEGLTPLHEAVTKNDNQKIEYLLDQKADPNICNNQGLSPLHIAIIQNNIQAVRLLLEADADVFIMIGQKDILKFAQELNEKNTIKDKNLDKIIEILSKKQKSIKQQQNYQLLENEILTLKKENLNLQEKVQELEVERLELGKKSGVDNLEIKDLKNKIVVLQQKLKDLSVQDGHAMQAKNTLRMFQ